MIRVSSKLHDVIKSCAEILTTFYRFKNILKNHQNHVAVLDGERQISRYIQNYSIRKTSKIAKLSSSFCVAFRYVSSTSVRHLMKFPISRIVFFYISSYLLSFTREMFLCILITEKFNDIWFDVCRVRILINKFSSDVLIFSLSFLISSVLITYLFFDNIQKEILLLFSYIKIMSLFSMEKDKTREFETKQKFVESSVSEGTYLFSCPWSNCCRYLFLQSKNSWSTSSSTTDGRIHPVKTMISKDILYDASRCHRINLHDISQGTNHMTHFH